MSQTSRSKKKRSSSPLLGERLVFVGLVVGFCAVPVAMDPGGYNLFGPAKTLLLAVSVALMLLGHSLAPARLVASVRMLAANRSIWALAAFCGLVLLSVVPATDPLSAFTGFYPEYQGPAALLAYLLGGLSAAALATDDRGLKGLLRALAVSVGIVSVFAVAQKMGLDPLQYRFNLNLSRARSTLGNASNLGLYLVLVVPLLVAHVRQEASTAWKAAVASVIGMSLLTLLWTDSRGAWVGAIVAGLAWAVLELRGVDRARQLRIWGAVTGSLAIGALLVALVAPGVASRAMSSFDPDSGTQKWRVSVWSSALDMTADRPLLGWGPNSFRAVYPLYRHADLAKDASDAQLVANAHNVFVNAAAESGPLAAIAIGAWFVMFVLEVWKAAGRRRGDLVLLASSASAVGAFVALQFHFLTLDTGMLFFGAVGIAMGRVQGDVKSKPERRASSSRFRWAVPAAAAVVGLLLIAGALGVVIADRAAGRGMSAAEGGAPWAQSVPEFDRAIAAAGWDPSFSWAKGRAAVSALQHGFDPVAFDDGMSALETALGRLPHETRLQAERADLLLSAGLTTANSGDAQAAQPLFQEALKAYESLVALDSNNGVLWIGQGSAQAGLGEWEAAVASYERGVELAKRSISGWSNLAIAYERTGRGEDAQAAKTRADDLQRELETAQREL